MGAGVLGGGSYRARSDADAPVGIWVYGGTGMATMTMTQTAAPPVRESSDAEGVDPLTIRLEPAICMTDKQFGEFCAQNSELRIERTEEGALEIMPPTFMDTGNRNFKVVVQLGNWAVQDGRGEGYDSSTGFTLPNGAVRSPDASWGSALAA